jgi:hypothetical protein
LLRHDGGVDFTHNNAAIGIPAASIGSAFTFLSRDAGRCRTRRNQRHGLVGLSPCFSPVLAPVSAESRHEAKQFFMLRGTVIGNSEEKKKKASGCTSAARHHLHNQSRSVRPRYQPWGRMAS